MIKIPHIELQPIIAQLDQFTVLTTLREQQELVRPMVHDCCITIMDLDHLKAVNDTYGHPAGDCVLAAVVHHMQIRPF